MDRPNPVRLAAIQRQESLDLTCSLSHDHDYHNFVSCFSLYSRWLIWTDFILDARVSGVLIVAEEHSWPP